NAYLFDSEHGLYRWDTRDDTSEFYPWTLSGSPLVGGTYVPRKQAIYGVSWWREGMPPTPLVKFDVKAKRYTAVFTSPWPDTRVMTPQQVGDRLFMTDEFGGNLMVFDLKSERWIGRYRLPDYESSWKYTTACTV